MTNTKLRLNYTTLKGEKINKIQNSINETEWLWEVSILSHKTNGNRIEKAMMVGLEPIDHVQAMKNVN